MGSVGQAGAGERELRGLLRGLFRRLRRRGRRFRHRVLRHRGGGRPMGLNLDPQALLMSAMTGGSSRAALLQQALQNTEMDPVMGQFVSQMLAKNETAEAEEVNEEI